MDAVIGSELAGALESAARGLDLAQEIRRELVMAYPENGAGMACASERLWRR